MSVLNKNQKIAINLLSIGTLLEYFDLFLYIHMAHLLNDLFFPSTDPKIRMLLETFTYSSTFLLRPIGAYFIGKIGDVLGRKYTILLTTTIMSVCCLVMCILPTYDSIGITASVIMILCRALQGFSSMGERLGAEIYLYETLAQPYYYRYSSALIVSTWVGSLLALFISLLSVSYFFNWRLAFLSGAIIGIIGAIARVTLRETPEYIIYYKDQTNSSKLNQPSLASYSKKQTLLVSLCYFIFKSSSAVCLYMIYSYFIGVAKVNFSFTPDAIIRHNIILSLTLVLFPITAMSLFLRFHPIKLGNILFCFSVAIIFLFFPHYINNLSNVFVLFFLQVVVDLPSTSRYAMEIACFKHIHVSKRFQVIGLSNGLSSLFSYGIFPFSLIFLSSYFGGYAFPILYGFLFIAFIFASSYIKKLEKLSGCYNKYPYHEKGENYEDSRILETEDRETQEEVRYKPFKV